MWVCQRASDNGYTANNPFKHFTIGEIVKEGSKAFARYRTIDDAMKQELVDSLK